MASENEGAVAVAVNAKKIIRIIVLVITLLLLL